MSAYSVGHGQVTQFGYFAFSESPGQPEKVITFWTPSWLASFTVLRNVSSSLLGGFLVRVKRIAMAGEGADFQPSAGDGG